MKQIHEMTEKEYNRLKASGMFWEVFPEATGGYVEDAYNSAINHIEATVEQEMRDAGYTDEDLEAAKDFGEKFEALRKTEVCCGQGGCGDCDVDFDISTELQGCENHTPTHTTVMYDATSLRIAVEWIYNNNHHINKKYSSVDKYEKSIMMMIARFIKQVNESEYPCSTSTGGLTINASWIGEQNMQLDFSVDPSVCNGRYSHYVDMEIGALIEFIESFADD